jgi:hypothetical protein
MPLKIIEYAIYSVANAQEIFAAVRDTVFVMILPISSYWPD